MPFGPPSLWAEISAACAPHQLKATGSLPKACVASVTASPSGRLWTMPVSELAICRTELPGSGTATCPSGPTSRLSATQASTASCSMALP